MEQREEEWKRYYLPSLHSDKIKHYLGNQWFNYDIHEQLSKILKKISFRDESESNIRVKRYIKFETFEAYGDYVLITLGINNVKDFFYAENFLETKNPGTRLGERVSTINKYNKLLIASEVTNGLKKEIPNFRYMYGMLEFGVEFDRSNMLGPLLSNSERFIIWEYVSSSFEYLFPKLTESEYLELLIQFFLSMETASNMGLRKLYYMRFFVRETQNPINIRYKIHNVVIRSKYILMIDPYIKEGDITNPMSDVIGFIDYIFDFIPKDTIPKDHFIYKIRGACIGFMYSTPNSLSQAGPSRYGGLVGRFIDMIKNITRSDFISQYRGQIYAGCDSQQSLCVKEDSLTHTTNEIEFGTIFDVYEYITSGGVINSGIEKVIPGFIEDYREKSIGDMNDMRGKLITITVPTINESLYFGTEQEGGNADYFNFLLAFRNQYVNLMKVKDGYDFEMELFKVFLYTADKLSYNVEFIRKEIEMVLEGMFNDIKNLKGLFRSSFNSFRQQNVVLDFNQEKLLWVKKHFIDQ